ncbi:MAG TPA: Ger(x)C family spore germination protein [Limnochordia bacterium]|nr:Ger(x)C family spore germination protein [Limnochordia bacterium]
MARATHFALGAALVAVAFIAGGCYDAKSVDNRSMIYALGFDDAPGDRIAVTAVEVNPQSSPAGMQPGSGTPGGKPSILFKGEGDTVAEAARAIQLKDPKQLSFASLGVVVFSKTLAEKQGIEKFTDFLMHDGHTRALAWAVISEDSAEKLLDTKVETESSTAYRDLFIAQGHLGTEAPEILSEPIWKVFRDSINAEGDPVLPMVRTTGSQIEFVGSALFHDDKLTGTLTPTQTATLQMLDFAAPAARMEVDFGPDQRAVLRLTRVNPELSIGPGPSLQIRLAAVARIDETTNLRVTPTPELIDRLENLGANGLRRNIADLLGTLAEDDCDALGIGGLLRANDPHEWEVLRASWPKSLKHWPVTIDVRLRIASTEL